MYTLDKRDKDKRPVLEVLTSWKEKKTWNINWNARILASLMFKITKRTKKRIKNHFVLDSSFFLLFSKASLDFSSSFLYWPSSIFCCPCRKSAWFILGTHTFNNLLPSSTNFSAVSIRWLKLAMASSTLFKSSTRFSWRLWKNDSKCSIVTLYTTPFYKSEPTCYP